MGALKVFATVANWVDARPVAMRWILAGPATLIAALLSMATMPQWLPEGSAGIDHLAFPIVLFPAIWAVLFFYACLDMRLTRATLVFAAVIGAQLALISAAFAGG
ncbi:MAG: hypothetical protein AAF415_16715 [Pseudomonadota bacterium]